MSERIMLEVAVVESDFKMALRSTEPVLRVLSWKCCCLQQMRIFCFVDGVLEYKNTVVVLSYRLEK